MWKTTDKVKIVYRNKDRYSYRDYKYKQAYVVTADTQLDAALRWAGTDAKVVETENKDFILSLGYAPGYSTNGGKLSFCNCIIEKEGLETFIVGINTEFLIGMLLDATMIKGKVNESIIFAKDNGNLGAIVVGSKQYNELVSDEAKRTKMSSSKKTKNWIPGSVYSTLTQDDLYIGEFRDVVEVGTKRTDKYSDTLDLVFNKESSNKQFTSSCYEDSKDISKEIYDGLMFGSFESCPARTCTAEVIPYNSNYMNTIKEKFFNYIKENSNKGKFYSATITLEIIFRFYDNDVEFVKKCLPYVLKIVEYNNEQGGYSRNDYQYFNITWDSKLYTLNTWEDFINKLIELC